MSRREDEPTEKMRHRARQPDGDRAWLVVAIGMVVSAVVIGAAIGMQWCNP